MTFLVGFTVYMNLSESERKAVQAAHESALAKFDHLQRKSIKFGETYLELWGHKEIAEQTCTLPDGSMVAVIGFPHTIVIWSDIQQALISKTFELPWDGRVIVLQVGADGRSWTMWNDWLGSIPVYHASIGHGRIASTLEPVVVAGGGYTANDIYLPALVSLMTNGHFISDWTLFKGMKTVPPDCIAEWNDSGFQSSPLGTITISQDRWDVSWDSMVDEMYEFSLQAIKEALQMSNSWILPLSAGLDSRLIAAVAAKLGTNIRAYSWGETNTTDVIYSRQIARELGFPWKHVDLPPDFLLRYTAQWADMFGSSMHFHGMYQMAFLDAIREEPGESIVSGFVGDVLSGSSLMQFDQRNVIYKREWYKHWTTKELKSLLRIPIDEPLDEIAAEVKKISDQIKGTHFPRALVFELQSRQRYFTSFQANLGGYWRGIATPFINRAYARFSLSLPRVALENRRLLGDVFRRYYGNLAVIPGTYGEEPFIRTGRYLIKQRIARRLPPALQIGPFAGFDQVPLRMDIKSIQHSGRESLWPLFDAKDQLSEWLDFKQLERDYQTVTTSHEDIRPLRRLQSAQTLAYRLIQ
jgi:hypothetical protein